MAREPVRSSADAQARRRSKLPDASTVPGAFVGSGSLRDPADRVVVVMEMKGTAAGPVEIEPLLVKITVLADALGSKSRAAEYLGVARSQPGKWLSGQERPNPRARRLIQDFDYVWDRLTDERSADVATLWLHSPNSFLNGATPITWLRQRGAEAVVGAIDAEEAGSFA